MKSESRVSLSLKNAKVGLLFYLLSLAVTFFSRKVFIDCLGKEFLGMTGVMGNILGMLNLAEMGIGTAVSFALYKPLHEDNKSRVIDVISLFGYFYKWVGSFVALGAIVVSIFLPSMMEKEGIPLCVAYFAFYSFLISSLLSYFVNYRQIVFSADQRQYLISIYSQSANLIKLVIQMSVAYVYTNYYAWILIELLFGITYSIVLQFKLRVHYPWLGNSENSGTKLVKDNPDVMKRTKQVFVHKLKDFFLLQSDQLFIFAYVSLGIVAIYGNYMMIISRLSSLFTVTMDGMSASIGNLIAEGRKDRILAVFWEAHAIRYVAGGFLAFCTFLCTNEFIELWLGKEYLLETSVLFLMSINLYMMFVRGTVDMFNAAFGLYGDTWSAWVEGGINIVLVVSLGPLWGINGILTGKLVSVFLMVFIWKPCYLFTCGLKVKLVHYWAATFKLLFSTVISWCTCYWILCKLKRDEFLTAANWIDWGIQGLAVTSIYAFISSLLALSVSSGFRCALVRFILILKNRFA